tara:strand:- start:14367 stop:15419 length:1053 start_codon:yes stop_codon:yes gene_type:complete
VIAGDAGPVTRYFTELDASAAQCYRLSSPVMLPNDFKILFDFSTSLVAAEGNLSTFVSSHDETGAGTISVDIRGNGVCRFVIFDANSVPIVLSTIDAYNDGKLHSGSASRIGDTLTLNVDGNAISTTSSGISDITVDVENIGCRSTTNPIRFFTGIISNPVIESGPTVVLDLPLDGIIPIDGIIENRAFGNPGAPSHATAVNLTYTDSFRFEMSVTNGGWLGDELVSNSKFENGITNWSAVNANISTINETLTIESISSGGRAEQFGVATKAGAVVFSAHLHDPTNTRALLYNSTGSSIYAQSEATSPEKFSTITVVEGRTAIKLRNMVDGLTAQYDDISVRQLLEIAYD